MTCLLVGALVKAVRTLHQSPKNLPVNIFSWNIKMLPEALERIKQDLTFLSSGLLQALAGVSIKLKALKHSYLRSKGL